MEMKYRNGYIIYIYCDILVICYLGKILTAGLRYNPRDVDALLISFLRTTNACRGVSNRRLALVVIIDFDRCM